MQIRRRLKAIASLVAKGANVIDVGCDHALLDIYLTLYNRNHCIASDVNVNAYNIAKDNVLKYELADKIDVVLSNGFENIDMNKTYTAVICGMGTSTILSILDTDQLDKLDTLIIQSNNDLYTLRKEVCQKGFFVDEELIVKERGIYYVLIRFIRGKKHYSLFDLWLGPIIRRKEQALKQEYLIHLIRSNEDILSRLPKKYVWKRIYLSLIKLILKKEILKSNNISPTS